MKRQPRGCYITFYHPHQGACDTVSYSRDSRGGVRKNLSKQTTCGAFSDPRQGKKHVCRQQWRVLVPSGSTQKHTLISPGGRSDRTYRTAIMSEFNSTSYQVFKKQSGHLIFSLVSLVGSDEEKKSQK